MYCTKLGTNWSGAHKQGCLLYDPKYQRLPRKKKSSVPVKQWVVRESKNLPFVSCTDVVMVAGIFNRVEGGGSIIDITFKD